MIASNDKVKAEEEFSRYHEKLRSELNIVNWHFMILKYIKEIQNDYLKELNQAPDFWGLTINAHVFSVLTHLNIFFGRKEKVSHLHMRSFLDFVKENPGIFSRAAFERRLRAVNKYDESAKDYNSEIKITTEKVDDDIRKLSNLPISSLKTWRNSILSHIDKDSVARNIDIAKRNPIRMKHIEEIIETLDNMLNEYLLAYNFSTYEKDLPIVHELQYVLDAIRFKLRS